MIEIHRYTAAYHRDWNDFVSESSNGTFLFLREYMEYHADRFTDYSLLVYEGNKLLALLPANRSGDVLYSHAGLTYGGLIVMGTGSSVIAPQAFSLVGRPAPAQDRARAVARATLPGYIGYFVSLMHL